MASSIVTSAVQQLGGLLVEEAKYLHAVSDKIKRLQTELEWMECFLEDADNREHQEKIVRKWVIEIRDIAYEAQDIIERYLHEVPLPPKKGIWNTIKWFSCCTSDALTLNDTLTLHDFGSNIDDLRNRISELIPRMQMYGIRSIGQLESSRYKIAVKEQRRTYSHTEEDPIGLETHTEEVVDKLVDNKEAKVVGISGMGGLGKTTLARKVFSDGAIKKYFKENCVWVYISKELDTKNIFQEILIGISNAKDEDKRKRIRELGDEELPRKICEVLKEKECLVVLDDIWYNRSWDTLKPAFASIKSSSSKILITTRNAGLVKYADPFGYSYDIGFLNEKDSWALLQRKAFSGQTGQTRVVEEKAKMEELAEKMLRHCSGLPLAIVALGGILAMRSTIHEWETIHKNISSYLISDMGRENEDDRVSQVLELSYYDLPFYLKPCFMYFGNFPEDFEIPAQKLYHLWEAEGLVVIGNDRAETEETSHDDIAESYLNQLVKRCMIQVDKTWPNGRIKSCRLHDVMRDMCLQKCKEVNFLNTIVWGSSKVPSKYIGNSSLANRKLRRCAIYWVNDDLDKSPFDPYLDEDPWIRSLLVFPCGSEFSKVEKLLWQCMRKFFSLLRVLDLDGTKINELPEAIGGCIHLRYLSLRRTWIRNLPPSIFDRKYLETLDLRIWGTVVMSDDFQKLERLRHLYLPCGMELRGSEKLKLSDNQLHHMETFMNFNLDKCQIEDLAKMVSLRIFSISYFPTKVVDRKTLELILNSPVIASGRLVNPLLLSMEAECINERPTILMVANKTPPVWMKHLYIEGRIEVQCDGSDVQIFPNNLINVYLRDCEIGKEGISELEKLPHLKVLRLFGKAVRGNTMSFSDGGFPQLASLKLLHLEELEEWEVGEGALPNLRYLEMRWCEKLTKIPDGLPSSIEIQCYKPCINGIENYNTCPDFKEKALNREAAGGESSS